MTQKGGAGGDPIPMPVQDPGDSEELYTALAARIASRFRIPGPLEALDFPDKGNINLLTFLIESGTPGATREFLLQQINQRVFARPQTVMTAMIASLDPQNRNLEGGSLPKGREWETITLIPTRGDALYLESTDLRGTAYWRLMKRIPDCLTFKSLIDVGERPEQLKCASEAGCGLAIYIDLTSDMDVSRLTSPLPGYRDTRIYYAQLNSVLAGSRTLEEAEPFLPKDDLVRESTQLHFLVHLSPEEYRRRMEAPDLAPFIALAKAEEHFGMTLLEEMAAGRIRTVAIHGDTKLENFLFNARTGRVRALVDLDTIMPHTWLADWGDMMRSLSNVAGEKERDLDRVQVDMEIYEAVARGFLGTARKILPAEVALMADAVKIIALELGVRFLADYLRGDSYFKLHATDPPDLNKVRAMVQLTLFERLKNRDGEVRKLIAGLTAS